jgi:hypothetical protein
MTKRTRISLVTVTLLLAALLVSRGPGLLANTGTAMAHLCDWLTTRVEMLVKRPDYQPWSSERI